MRAFAVAIFFVLGLLWGSATPSVAAEKMRVGISIPTADHGWTGGIVWWAERAVKEFAEKNPNIEFIFKTSVSDKEQSTHVQAMLAAGIKALVILPHKPAPLTTVLNRVHTSGAYIVVVDRSIPKVPKNVYIAGDNTQFGVRNGEQMAALLQGKGNIVVMEGIPCEGNTLRVKGFLDAVKPFPNIKLLESQPVYWSPDKGYEMMKRYLAQFAHIDAVWCGDDDVLESVLKAYKESGRTDIRYFLGGGGSKAIIKMVLDNDPFVQATVSYPPKMSYEAIAIAVDHITTGKVHEPIITMPSELIIKENAKDYYYPDSIY